MDETKSKLNPSSRFNDKKKKRSQFWTNGTGRREKGVPVRPGIGRRRKGDSGRKTQHFLF